MPVALDLLTRWTHDFCRMTGHSARALDEAQGVVLDVSGASLIAIEWQAVTHTLHVYGRPGRRLAAWPIAGQRFKRRVGG